MQNPISVAMKAIQIRIAIMAKKNNLRVLWGNFRTASTGPGYIKMPYFDASDPLQTLAAYGFGSHEGAHHRYGSKLEVYEQAKSMGPIYKEILNILDDGRINRRSVKEFPGQQRDLESTMQVFQQKGSFLEIPEDTPLVGAVLAYLSGLTFVDYVGIELLRPFKESALAVIQQTCSPDFPTIIDKIVEDGVKPGDFDSAWAATLRLVSALKDELERQEEQNQPQPKPDASDDESDPEEGEGNPEPDAGDDGSDQEKIAALIQRLNAQINDEDVPDFGAEIAKLLQPMDVPPTSEGLKPMLTGVLTSKGKSNHVSRLNLTSRLLRNALAEFVETETRIAPGYGRRGKRFIVAKKPRFLQGDMRCFRTRAEDVGIDTSTLISLDLSGSMESCAREAIDACLSLSLALEDIDGVRVAVQTFGDELLDVVGFGESVTEVSARFDGLEAAGSTPLQEALSNAYLALMPEETAKKSLIVITDGVPDERCESLVAELRKDGIDVFGIFIGDYKVGKGTHMDSHFGPQGWVAVQDANQLSRELFKLARHTLLAA